MYKNKVREKIFSVTAVDRSVGSKVQVSERKGDIDCAFTYRPPWSGETIQIWMRLLSNITSNANNVI